MSLVICQSCQHHPGISQFCHKGHRHATAQPKRCTQHRLNDAATEALRRAAHRLHQTAPNTAYVTVLHIAHDRTSEASQ